jgi:hypothetical protein
MNKPKKQKKEDCKTFDEEWDIFEKIQEIYIIAGIGSAKPRRGGHKLRLGLEDKGLRIQKTKE